MNGLDVLCVFGFMAAIALIGPPLNRWLERREIYQDCYAYAVYELLSGRKTPKDLAYNENEFDGDETPRGRGIEAAIEDAIKFHGIPDNRGL